MGNAQSDGLGIAEGTALARIAVVVDGDAEIGVARKSATVVGQVCQGGVQFLQRTRQLNRRAALPTHRNAGATVVVDSGGVGVGAIVVVGQDAVGGR